MVCFQCVDDELVEVDEQVAMVMGLVKGMMRNKSATGSIVLLNITTKMLRKIIQYCEKRMEGAEKVLNEWEDEFMDVDKETLFEMANAAYYMKVEGLVELISKTMAKKIGGMSASEVQRYLSISESQLLIS